VYETQVEASSPSIVVTVIHGTWASKANWIREDSMFCTLIRFAFPLDLMQIVPFRWSGHNSVSARYKAALALAQQVEESSQRWPEAQHILIGHSHGGSVALIALRMGGLAERICGVACLSTPFLLARIRPMTPIAKASLTWAPALTVYAVIANIANISGLQAIMDRHEFLDKTVMFVTFILSALVWFLTPRIVQSFSNKVFERMKLAELKPDQLFILRAPGDEASAALGAAQILNFAVSRIWEGLAYLFDNSVLDRVGDWYLAVSKMRWLHVLNIFLLISIFSIALFVPITLLSKIQVNHIGQGVLIFIGFSWGFLLACNVMYFIGIFLLAVVAAPLPLILAILVFPFAPELAIVSLALNVSAEPTPPGVWAVRQLQPESSSSLDPNSTLMHSVSHESISAIDLLTGWMKVRLRHNGGTFNEVV
jgi:pimeloyl-ACP methyl ester carboxylesterase